MKTLNVLEISTGLNHPAEIRSYDNGEMTVLVKDFETARMDTVKLKNIAGDNWTSDDSKYTASYPKDAFTTATETLVRVSKK